MLNLKNRTRLIVEVDHIGDRYVMLDTIKPDGQRKSIAYHRGAHGKWICVRDGAPINDDLCDLFDVLIATHDTALPAVEEDLYDREK